MFVNAWTTCMYIIITKTQYKISTMSYELLIMTRCRFLYWGIIDCTVTALIVFIVIVITVILQIIIIEYLYGQYL